MPCALGGAGEAMVVAVAAMEPDASRVTETVPDGLVMDAEPAPSLLTVAVAPLLTAQTPAPLEAAAVALTTTISISHAMV